MPINSRGAKAHQFRGQVFGIGQVRSALTAEVGHGVTLEQITDPAYWWPVSARLKPLDTLEVVWEDGSRITVLRCMGKDDRSQRLVWEVVTDHLFSTPPAPAGFAFEWVNKGLGWRVLQDGRRQPLRSGFATALEASLWLTADGAVETTAQAVEKPKTKALKAPAAAAKAEGAEAA